MFIYLTSFNLKKCLLAKHGYEVKLLPELMTDIYYQADSMGLKIKQPFYIINHPSTPNIRGLCKAARLFKYSPFL